MAQAKVSEGQSLMDVAIQELGSVAALFDLADAAGLAITDVLAPGQVLPVPTSTNSAPEVVTYFKGRGQRINTGDEMAPLFSQFHDWDLNDFDHPDFD